MRQHQGRFADRDLGDSPSYLVAVAEGCVRKDSAVSQPASKKGSSGSAVSGAGVPWKDRLHTRNPRIMPA